MITLLAEYVTAVTAVLGTALGVLIGRRMRPRPPEPIRPICTCRHGYGTHADGRDCQGADRDADHWDHYGHADHWIFVGCHCLRYDGPDPTIFGLDAS